MSSIISGLAEIVQGIFHAILGTISTLFSIVQGAVQTAIDIVWSAFSVALSAVYHIFATAADIVQHAGAFILGMSAVPPLLLLLLLKQWLQLQHNTANSANSKSHSHWTRRGACRSLSHDTVACWQQGQDEVD